MASKRRIKSDATLLGIIEMLREREGAGVTEVAEALGISKGTVHAHLAGLEEHGYVVKSDGQYHLGLRFLDLGIFARDQRDLFRFAKSVVDELAETTNEKAWCIIEEHGKAVYLYGAVGRNSVKTWADTGEYMDLHSLAAGKAILAHVSDERREEILSDAGMEQYTQDTITDLDELASELDRIRERGVAFNFGESVRDLNAIGAPVRGEGDVVHGAISVSGPANRMTREKLESELTDLILGSANEIEINIRYS